MRGNKTDFSRKILLLGANDQAMLLIARQLNVNGFIIDVADWQDLTVKHSKYINKYYKLTDLELNAEAFVHDLCKIIEADHYLFLQPVNDAALEICIKFNNKLEGIVRLLAVNDEKVYEFAHNKYLLLKKCVELVLHVPDYKYIDNLNSLTTAVKDLKYPVVAKPVYSKLIKDNKLYQFRVKKIYSENELIDFVRENILNVPFIIQDYIEGYGAGYNIIAKDGNIILAYQHERITEPIGGGASSYRKTNEINKYGLKDCSEKIIKSIGWTGPAMLEYRICNNIPYIMEINGRFWGSMALGIFAGLDYPVSLVDLLYYNKNISYKENDKIVFARNFKMDLHYALSKTLHYKNPINLLRFVKSLKNSFRSNEVIEDNLFIDFKLEFFNYLRLIKKGISLIFRKVLLKFMSVKKEVPEIKKGLQIAFLCYGNICRSPFSEEYARKHFSSDFIFYSFGLVKQENRLPPINAVSAAESFKSDISLHPSKYLSADAVEKIDLIFVMDKFNYYTFKKLYPEHINKVFFLDNNIEIKDPYSKDINAFINTYKLIAKRIDLIFTDFQ